MSDVYPRHLALTPQRLGLRRIFPWSHTVGKILYATRPEPCPLGHLLIGSDYSGAHRGSRFRTYAFLALAAAPPSWWRRRNSMFSAPSEEPPRRLSYKRLNNPLNYALGSQILEEGDKIPGVLVVFAIEHGLRLNPMSESDMRHYSNLFSLSAKWKHRSLEDAYLKAHLFSLVASQWARANSDVTWITDEDEFVANEKRLDDAQKIASRLLLAYMQSSMGTFAMNTTAIDGPDRDYEDLLAIPDLAAGMMSDLLSEIAQKSRWQDFGSRYPVDDERLKTKTVPLVDWFWDDGGELRKVCIVFDRVDKKLRVFRLDQVFEN